MPCKYDFPPELQKSHCKYCDFWCDTRPKKLPIEGVWDKARAAAIKFAPFDKRESVNNKRIPIRDHYRAGFMEGYSQCRKDTRLTPEDVIVLANLKDTCETLEEVLDLFYKHRP